MDWETLRKAVDLLLRSRQTVVTLQFYGGEPLLEFPLLQRGVEYVAEHSPAHKRVRFAVSTNGLGLCDARAAFLAHHGFETQLSFDGVPEAQEQRGPGSFSFLDGLLDRIRKRHPAFFARDLTVSMTLTASSLPHLADSIEYFIGKGVPCIFVGPRVTHDPDWTPRHVGELDRQVSRVRRRCLQLQRTVGAVPLLLFRRSHGPPAPGAGWMCNVGRARGLVVDVDGQVVGCPLLASSYQSFPSPLLGPTVLRLRLGRLGDPGLWARLEAYPEALRATGLFDRKMDKYSSYGRCRRCRHSNDCRACPVSIGHIPGNTDPNRVPDLVCAFNRATLEHRERFLRASGLSDLMRRVLIPNLARRLVGATPSSASRP